MVEGQVGLVDGQGVEGRHLCWGWLRGGGSGDEDRGRRGSGKQRRGRKAACSLGAVLDLYLGWVGAVLCYMVCDMA